MLSDTILKKNRYLLFSLLFVFVLLLFSSSSFAIFESSYAVFEFDSKNLSLLDATAVPDHFYYKDILFEDILLATDHSLVFLDSKNKLLYELPLKQYKTIVDYDLVKSVSKINIMKNKFSIFSRDFSFCNKNNICEPCSSVNCSSAENSFTCSDCKSGSKDFFCDLKKDGICDPDCNNEEVDCSECLLCLSDNSSKPLFCEEDFSGTICSKGEVCVGDRLIVNTFDANNGSSCCVGAAFCAIASADVPSEVFEANYSVNLSYEAEFIEIELMKSNSSNAGFDTYFMEEDSDLLNYAVNNINLSYKKSSSANLSDSSLDPVVMTEAEWDSLVMDRPASSEILLLPNKTVVEKVVEKISNISKKPKEVITSIESNLIWVIFVLIILLIIAGVVASFITKSSKKLNIEETRVRIENEVVGLLRQGYSYEQIKTILINKGYDMLIVNGVITTYYQKTRFDNVK